MMLCGVVYTVVSMGLTCFGLGYEPNELPDCSTPQHVNPTSKIVKPNDLCKHFYHGATVKPVSAHAVAGFFIA